MRSCLFLCLILTGCANFRTCDDAWTGPDKTKHFLAAGGISAGTYWIVREGADLDQAGASAAAMGIAMAAGLGKEAHDLHRRNTCWSWRDVVWDFIGASAGLTL
ncbi:MAG: hypothetical protein KDL10_11550, partial [Kiritimatiellae bacterium]|nr:hypothetical protein [Kiritimatiellia bacterium]